MKKFIRVLFSAAIFLAFCSADYQQYPEKGGDKAINLVLDYNKTLGHLQDSVKQLIDNVPDNELASEGSYAAYHELQAKEHDDTYFINHNGDSSLQAFDKQVISTPHVDRKSDVGIRYTSRANKWSYYVARESKEIYAVNYVTLEGERSLLWYRVNLASGVIELTGF